MVRYALRRLIATVPVIAVVAVVVFLLLHLAPGDPAVVIAGDNASAAEVARIRTQLGLDRPLIEQFWVWLVRLLHGDLGQSIYSNLPVARLILQRVGPTLALATSTLVVSVLIAVLLGVIAAVRAGSFIDHLVMLIATLGLSAPVFVVGYLMVLAFSVGLDWLPVQGYSPPAAGIGPFVGHLALPTVALALNFTALIARMTRASMLEVLAQDYIRTAYAKGIGRPQVVTVHALKNAAVPIVTTIGIGVALLISGVVITESVFNIPGIGRLVVDAITRRDYPIIQGTTLVFALVYVLLNLLVDLSYVVLDPRIRY
jgi:peptide/nickel transport system permease protein